VRAWCVDATGSVSGDDFRRALERVEAKHAEEDVVLAFSGTVEVIPSEKVVEFARSLGATSTTYVGDGIGIADTTPSRQYASCPWTPTS
jgi:hypothetical protein